MRTVTPKRRGQAGAVHGPIVSTDVEETPIAVEDLQEQVANLTTEVDRLQRELMRVKRPPHVVGIVQDILEDGQLVVRSTTGPVFVVTATEELGDVAPGDRVRLLQGSLQVQGLLPKTRDILVQESMLVERPTVRYEDVAGLDEILEQVRETIELPLLHPERLEALGIQAPKGVLLTGAPGTGKTLIAKAVAGETNASFLRITASELVMKFIGEGARRVREVFQMARDHAPSILFIDEIDGLAAKRADDGTSSNREVERTLLQLLAELDGFDARGDVRIIAATNRKDMLDPALLRPGRFDRILMVPKPNEAAQRKILEVHTRGVSVAGELDDWTPHLQGFTGAQIEGLVREAGMIALREGADAIDVDHVRQARERMMKHRSKGTPKPAGPFYA